MAGKQLGSAIFCSSLQGLASRRMCLFARRIFELAKILKLRDANGRCERTLQTVAFGGIVGTEEREKIRIEVPKLIRRERSAAAK